MMCSRGEEGCSRPKKDLSLMSVEDTVWGYLSSCRSSRCVIIGHLLSTHHCDCNDPVFKVDSAMKVLAAIYPCETKDGSRSSRSQASSNKFRSQVRLCHISIKLSYCLSEAVEDTKASSGRGCSSDRRWVVGSFDRLRARRITRYICLLGCCSRHCSKCEAASRLLASDSQWREPRRMMTTDVC